MENSKIWMQRYGGIVLAVILALPTISGGQDPDLSELSYYFNPYSKQPRQTDVRLEEPFLLEPHNSIREVVSHKYWRRYLRWKNEFLATEMGRRQWEMYQHKPDFTLTVTVSTDNPYGAETGKYKWNEEGKPIAATITLGCKLDEKYPKHAPYPVTNSLALILPYKNGGEILAATKIAHEFGHLNQLFIAGSVLRLQNQLMPAYNEILLANGLNTFDSKLIELAKTMGGTPAQISEDREYWSEVNAMQYLFERISKKSSQCALVKRIRETLKFYAKRYEEHFARIAESKASVSGCRWR